MTSLIMQMRVKTNFFNDIFNQMDKKLGKRTNFFFVFYYRVSYDCSNYLCLKLKAHLQPDHYSVQYSDYQNTRAHNKIRYFQS